MERSRQFAKDEVVICKNDKEEAQPGKIIKKSSYGTYKIRIYGSKTDDYFNEYRIFKFDPCLFTNTHLDRKTRKWVKVAEKDNLRFKKEDQDDHQEFDAKCKDQEEQDNENSQCGYEIENPPSSSIVEEFEKLPIQNLVEDYQNSGITHISYQNYKGELIKEEHQSKFIIMKKFEWALERILLDIKQPNTEKIIEEIFESEIIEPVDFFCCRIFSKLIEVIESGPTGKKSKFRSLLIERKSLIIKGIEAYMENYSFFLKAYSQVESAIGDYL